jgi:murein DD-endopeptidase MepM/ murein hydrolase activator NlpD
MGTSRVCLVAMAIWLAPHGALACDASKAEPGHSPLHTRKPVADEAARLTHGFGMRRQPLHNSSRMHNGVDWAAPVGTPVLAAAGGRVVAARGEDELGRTVRIDHGAGWETVYARLASFEVGEGDCVAPLAVIGRVGSMDPAGGPALHFEVHANGRPINPLSLPTPANSP